MEITKLNIILSINEIKVSFIVAFICINKLFCLYKLKIQFITLDGEDKIKELIIWYLDSNSHNIKNNIIIKNLMI